MTDGIREASPPDRIAGGFYLLTFLAAVPALFLQGGPQIVANGIAGACYLAVTALFYFLFKPAGKRLSLLAAILSLAGVVIGPLNMLHLVPFTVSPLVFFGFYCLLISCLIFRSTFLPRFLGVLMAFAALGWLTFLYPPLSKELQPYNLFPGILGEACLTVWLLARGVDASRWKEQARSR
jgi:hypothetical protein